MAKGIYVGIDSKARKVKKPYVGVAEDSLVANGDFSNGLSGWTVSATNYFMTKETTKGGENCVEITLTTPTTAGTNHAEKVISHSVNALNMNHIYYFGYRYYGDSGNNNFRPIVGQTNGTGTQYFATATDCSAPEWQSVSERKECTVAGNSIHLALFTQNANSELTAGMKMYFTNFKVYDLTAMFGAGNEPTKEWCDTNLEELKTLYKSQNSKARKVKKGYIGVADVARPFYSVERKIEYYGTVTALSKARRLLAGASVGSYVLFAGGFNDSYLSTVEAYDKSLTQSTPVTLSQARQGLAGASVGNYGLFAGGQVNSSGSTTITVDAYNNALTRSTATALSQARRDLASANVGDYVLFAGGYYSSYVSVVDSYDANLTRSTEVNLSEAKTSLAGASVGNYALFAGGQINGSGFATTKVDAYDKTLTKSTPTALSELRLGLAGTNVGDYALFAGGQTSRSGYSAKVDAYNTTLVRSTPATLTSVKTLLAATTTGDYALFAGGYNGSYFATVDVYDETLTKSTPTALSQARYQAVGANVGDYALFAGGYNGSYLATVDAYQA